MNRTTVAALLFAALFVPFESIPSVATCRADVHCGQEESTEGYMLVDPKQVGHEYAACLDAFYSAGPKACAKCTEKDCHCQFVRATCSCGTPWDKLTDDEGNDLDKNENGVNDSWDEACAERYGGGSEMCESVGGHPPIAASSFPEVCTAVAKIKCVDRKKPKKEPEEAEPQW